MELNASSVMPAYRPIKAILKDAWRARRDMCMDGAPWMPPTVLYANDPAVERLQLTCTHDHRHQALRGHAPCGLLCVHREG